jgi:hypothetical protein
MPGKAVMPAPKVTQVITLKPPPHINQEISGSSFLQLFLPNYRSSSSYTVH